MRAIQPNEATDLSRLFESAWNARNPSAVVRLLRHDAVWRDNESVTVGLGDIWKALECTWTGKLHYASRHTLQTHRADAVVLCRRAEWQDAQHGGWRRQTGELTAVFDDNRRITTLESTTVEQAITAAERELSILRSDPHLPGGNSR